MVLATFRALVRVCFDKMHWSGVFCAWNLNQVQTVVWAETCTFANLLPISHFCAAIAQSPLKPFNVKHNSEFSMKCNLALFSSWNLARIPSWSKSSSRVSGGLDKLWRNCPAVFYFSNRQRQRNQHKCYFLFLTWKKISCVKFKLRYFVMRQYVSQIYPVLWRGNFCRKFMHFWV